MQKARHIINALKNGVVPENGLDALCVGRSRELAEFRRCLDTTADGNGVVKFICGEYGSGKTFLMNAVKQQAIAANFVIADVQVSRSFRFNNIENLYYHIMHSITMSSFYSASGFESIFDAWIKKLQAYEDTGKAALEINSVIAELNRYNVSFARAFLYYIKARIERNMELYSAAASWLMGEKNIPAALKSKFEVVGYIDKLNSIDFLKAFIKLVTLLGYSGLVVLVDELELVMRERVDIRRVSYENLRYIIDICCSGEMPNCMFVFAGTNDFFENEEKGVKTYQALYQRLGDAMDKNGQGFYDMRQPIVRLRKPNSEEYQELTDRIISIYKVLYDFQPNTSNESIKSWTLLSTKKFGSKMNDLSIREYLTKLIEVLDIMEQHPENNIFI